MGALRPKGMKRHMPKGSDSSMKPKGGSVNDSVTRKGVAATPSSLGPRTA